MNQTSRPDRLSETQLEAHSDPRVAPSGTRDVWKPRSIGIVGAGVMGTSLAAIVGRIAPVVMVCRNPAARAAFQSTGVRTTGMIDAAAKPQAVASIPQLEAGGGVSVLFVATKTNAIPEVAAALRPVHHRIGDQGAAPFVVSYQNGIEPGRQLIEMLSDDRVLRMVLNLGARPGPTPGEVEITMNQPPHFIGWLNPEHVPACRQIAALLTAGGLETHLDDQIEQRVWAKGVINAAMNPVAALLDLQVGQVLDSPSAGLVESLLREGQAVAQARGIDLGPAFLQQAQTLLNRARPHTPSMVQDIRAGRQSEVGQLNRQIVEHAGRLGVNVPTHRLILSLIETFDWKVYNRRRISDAPGA